MQLFQGELDGFASKVRRLEFPAVYESRGALVEFDYRALPFVPRRTFLVRDVPPGTVRGGHAHAECEQVLACLRGRLTVELAFGGRRARLELLHPAAALYIGAGVWSRQTYEEPGTELLALASMPFDPASYLGDAESAGPRLGKAKHPARGSS